MHLRICIYHLLLLVGLACSARAQADSSLKLSIVPERSHEKMGASVRTVTPFYVVAVNQSNKPIRVWREWCSWGYYALSLEAKLPDGTVVPITKKGVVVWTKNYPDHFIILPGEYFVMPVKLKDEWEGFHAKEEKVFLRAHYKIVSEEYAAKEGVWTGEVISPWIEVTLRE
jgi:hypothetical protein